MNFIKHHLVLFVAMAMGTYIVACAPVNFERKVNCGAGCIGVSGGQATYSESMTIAGGKVDILIVDDNSASMSTEQHAMAARLGNLVSVLDSQSIDYRIAITTTDVSATAGNSPSPANQFGALQDGKLITYGDGSSYITPKTTNRVSLFQSAVVRQETFNCESWLNTNFFPSESQYHQNCPSDDERGVYAANLAVLNNSSGFIRSDAALAVVFLSDEDERSGLYSSYSAYALDNNDQPKTLINNIQNIYAGKNFVAHSIIVKPGDSACLQTQNSQSYYAHGSYGSIYSQASSLTGGVVGNICASDYYSQLSVIGAQVAKQTNSVPLQCSSPQGLVVTVNGTVTTAYQVVGNQVQFTQTLAAGTTVQTNYTCN